MKILYLVQRYGEDIVGGSEAACRQFAEHLVVNGHEVTVLTSCARSYVTWENSYAAGKSILNGVHVQRLKVREARRPERFGPMDQWLMRGTGRPGMWEHERWARLMGPDLVGLRGWLLDHHREFDIAIFMTYLYSTATLGMPVVAGRLPVIFQPTAHDEPPLRVPIFDAIFRLPDAFLFFTPEERTVVEDRFLFVPEGETVGIGIDLEPVVAPPDSLLRRHGIAPGDPYLLYVGRLDPMKGVKELVDFFREFKARNTSRLKLVLAGDQIVDLPSDPSIIVTGFLDEPVKQGLIRGALALVQPSYFESFSIVLCEAWVHSRPALVQGQSPVLKGQAERSAGAIHYEGFAEFEQAVMILEENKGLVEQLGSKGRQYVEDKYRWSTVLEGVERTIEKAHRRFDERAVTLRARN